MAYNRSLTCWNCPAANLKGNVDFRACGQSKDMIREKIDESGSVMIECNRRPELGYFEPTLTFEQCDQWEKNEDYGMFMLKDMRVMILGIDGYLGWALALKLAKMGYQVSGTDCYNTRKSVAEKGADSAVPIGSMEERIKAAKEVHGVDIDFREIDLLDLDAMREYLTEIKPEAIVHYAEYARAPYSMVDAEHSIRVQQNNVMGTLGLLWLMKEIVPETSLLKLGTMGEYGSPLTGRPIFEGIFPADAVMQWDGREWSLGGELTPRDPVSFYHVSKVQDTFNVYEACKYWWLRSYDIMQGFIYGVHTEEMAADPRLRTRLDIDEWHGTVIHRFVSETVIDMPMTIYGEGDQIRGALALDEAMDCMVRLICTPPEAGQYDVVNQVSGLHKIKDLAETVAKVGKEFGLNPKISRLENPRVEADFHPLEVVSQKLPEKGFDVMDPEESVETEVRHMFELLTQPHVKEKIEELKEHIMPTTRWDGSHKKSEKIEEYDPGTKEKTGYVGTLVTEGEKDSVTSVG
jgi:UDP-sulfoquinovose synthase